MVSAKLAISWPYESRGLAFGVLQRAKTLTKLGQDLLQGLKVLRQAH